MNKEEFAKLVDEEFRQTIWDIYDNGEPDRIDGFLAELKAGYPEFRRAAREHGDEIPWLPAWFDYLCFLLCEYEFGKRDYEELRVMCFELGGLLDE